MALFKSNAANGVCIMILGAGVLSMNDAATKYLAETYPMGQVLGLRQSVALLVILAYVWWSGSWEKLRIKHRSGQAWRAAVHCGSAVLIIWALTLLPIATVTAIVFSSPLVVLIFSMRFLGEGVSWQRWIAVIIGFTGVLVIVRPGGVSFEWALLVAVSAAIVSGFRDLLTRRLSRTDTSISMLFWASALLITLSFLTIPFGWHPLTLSGSFWFIINGLLNAGAHFLMIEALRLGDAALVSPFRYSAILWAILTGFIVWNQLPDTFTVVGAAMLIISGILISRPNRHEPSAKRYR
jgi:drug/metabolite transporter (DMT)-like permease